MTERPKYYDDRLPALAAELILPRVVEWLEQEGEPADCDGTALRHLTEAIQSARSNLDGYLIAKALDDEQGWSVNAELVDILDGTCGAYGDAFHGLQEAWVKENGVTLALPVGSEVTVNLPRDQERIGIVAALHPEVARYTVRIPSLGHVESGLGTHGNILNKEEVEK